MFLFSFFLLIKGFCCWCSEQDKWRGSFKDTTPFSRAGLSCKVFGKAQAAAHCMKYDDLWYVSIESLSLAAYWWFSLSRNKKIKSKPFNDRSYELQIL